MVVDSPPVCSRCSDQPESVTKLEQHVRTRPTQCPRKSGAPKGLLDGDSDRVSLTEPLNPAANKIGGVNQGQRMPPPWMTLLPSNRHSANPPPESLSSVKHSSSPVSQGNTTSATPFVTQPQWPATVTHEQPARKLSLSSLCETSRPALLPSPEVNSVGDRPTASAPLLGWPIQQGLPGNISTQASSSRPKDMLASPLSGSQASQVEFKDILRRSFSIAKGINTFRRSSTTKTGVAPAGSCGSPSSHTPTPSQDISPARTPFFKELSSFFTSRARMGKLVLPSRLDRGQGNTRLNGSGTSTSGRSELERTCEKCGVDLSDWWVGREPGAQSQDHESSRVCKACKATEPMPKTMPGIWD